MTWKNNFEKGKEIILSSASKSAVPNANVVMSLGFDDDELVVANCQMNNTIKNLKENNFICVLGGYFRLVGSVEIYSSGSLFDKAVLNSDEDYPVKEILIITIDSVFDLDKGKFVFNS
jgi:hypothetical protein